jgi:hypothetical protein
MDHKTPPWKAVEKRGVCHYPDVSDEKICIVSVDNFESPHWAWKGKEDRYRGQEWFVVIFDEATRWAFLGCSSEPFPTLEEAIRYAEKMVPTGIEWQESRERLGVR